MRIRVLVAFDKFKDSLDAVSVGNAVLTALSNKFPTAISQQSRNLPLSDGGEGFLSSLTEKLSLETKTVTVTGPLPSQRINAKYGLGRDRVTNEPFAVIEMAQASGLEHVAEADRNPLNTTTRGLGELIMDAVHEIHQRAANRKYTNVNRIGRILIGIGGSATNDAGLGAVHALQSASSKPLLKVFLQQDGSSTIEQLPANEPFCGSHLHNLADIQWDANVYEELFGRIEIDIACDVSNPFIGPNGAVHVFSLQKGLTKAADRDRLENAMKRLATIMANNQQIKDYKQSRRVTGWNTNVAEMPGAGAAGGVGGGFEALLNAKLRKGIEVLADYVGLEQAIANSDLVFTGEGSYDAQTAGGKVVSQVLSLSAKHGKPCFVICGRNGTTDFDASKVFDLLSMFDVKTSMSQTGSCIQKLVEVHGDKFITAATNAAAASEAPNSKSRL